MPTSLEAAIQASAQRLARDLVRQLRGTGVHELIDFAATRPAVRVDVGDVGAAAVPTASVRSGKVSAAAAADRIERAIREEATEYALAGRDVEILAMSVNGLPRKALAREFGVAEQTMKMSVRKLLRKLNADSLTDVTTRVMRRAVRFA